jgi:hypothetical protein
MAKTYCTQNNGDCSTCSLSNYNRDCQNNPIHGGYREGSGRPSTGRKKHNFYITDEENEAIKKLIKTLRGEIKMDSHEAIEKLVDYAKGLKTWEEIVTPINVQNFSYGIDQNGILVVMCEDGNVTNYTARYAIDSIESDLCVLTVLERKIEKILYFFYDKVDGKMIIDLSK